MAHEMKTVYEVIGPEKFDRLVHGFYRRVASDPVVRPLYPEETLEEAERHLRLFLIQYFGGPKVYSDERGHPRLRMRHLPFRIGEAERDAWLRCMRAALDEAAIGEPAYSLMARYFEDTATFMMNDTPLSSFLPTDRQAGS